MIELLMVVEYIFNICGLYSTEHGSLGVAGALDYIYRPTFIRFYRKMPAFLALTYDCRIDTNISRLSTSVLLSAKTTSEERQLYTHHSSDLLWPNFFGLCGLTRAAVTSTDRTNT